MITRLAIEAAGKFTYVPWMLHRNKHMREQLSPPVNLIRQWAVELPVDDRETFVSEQVEEWEEAVAEAMPFEFCCEMSLLKRGVEPQMHLLPSEQLFGS